MGCHVTLQEVGRANFAMAPDPPAVAPEIVVSSAGLLIATRCPDYGDVNVEVWAGDPGGPPAEWDVVFDGQLETTARGFDAGTATASVFHVNARPGKYSVRTEVHRDNASLIDGVRFIFRASDLDGETLY